MKAYKCDRCGKFFERYEGQVTSNFFMIAFNPHCLDLCPNCNAKLQEGMTKTICDICGKEMTASVFTDSNFRISSNGVKLDICNECKEEFNKWMKERYEHNTLFAESEECDNSVKETNNQTKLVINQIYSPVDFCNYGECPTCGETVSGFSIGDPDLWDKECPKCGQKLKWK